MTDLSFTERLRGMFRPQPRIDLITADEAHRLRLGPLTVTEIDDRLHYMGYPTQVVDGRGRAWRLSGNLTLLQRQIVGAVIDAGDHDCLGVIGSTLTAIEVPVLGSTSRFVRWHFAYRSKETP